MLIQYQLDSAYVVCRAHILLWYTLMGISSVLSSDRVQDWLGLEASGEQTVWEITQLNLTKEEYKTATTQPSFGIRTSRQKCNSLLGKATPGGLPWAAGALAWVFSAIANVTTWASLKYMNSASRITSSLEGSGGDWRASGRLFSLAPGFPGRKLLLASPWGEEGNGV
jgi:hypothetical protein